jgi:hypothetical protein
MKEKYYFCFQFNVISLLNDVQEDLSAQTHFQIEILKSSLLSI